MTLVGVDVTRINANDEVIPAGIPSKTGSIFKFCASAISNGTTIVPVTVLLENATFINDTPNTIVKTIRTGCNAPMERKATQAIQFHCASPSFSSVCRGDREVTSSAPSFPPADHVARDRAV